MKKLILMFITTLSFCSIGFASTTNGLTEALDDVRKNCPVQSKQASDLRAEIIELAKAQVLSFDEAVVFMSAVNGSLAEKVHTADDTEFEPVMCRIVYANRLNAVKEVIAKFIENK
jgi:hypothetical protein